MFADTIILFNNYYLFHWFSEKDCPSATVGNSNGTMESGYVYNDTVIVVCNHGYVRDDGNNNLTTYEIGCVADATWSDVTACTSMFIVSFGLSLERPYLVTGLKHMYFLVDEIHGKSTHFKV